MKADLAAARIAGEQSLAEQRAALIRQRQQTERELSLNRRELREADLRVKQYRDDDEKLRKTFGIPNDPYQAEPGVYFLAPVQR